MAIDKEPIEQETQSDVDIEAAEAEISSELFGQGDDVESDEGLAEGEESKASGDPSADAAKVPPQPKKAEGEVVENADDVQAIGAPKTWTKEALESWATIPSRAQQEILKREEDFFRGVSQYKQAADVGQAYDSVVAPFRPMLEQENVNPIQLFQSFAANHYMLSRGTPEQKVEIAASLINGYNIPLEALLNHIAEGNYEAPNPQMLALQNELATIKNSISSAQSENTNRIGSQLMSEIQQFAADPAHPDFDELAGDISKLFEAGLATSLSEAYEKAVYANPVTRQKALDRRDTDRLTAAQTEAAIRKNKRARLTADSVDVSSKAKGGTTLTGSIDDTLQETMDAIQSRS